MLQELQEILYQVDYMDKKLKIGITGASGLVGSHLASSLVDDGIYEVFGLHTSGYIPNILKDKKVNWVKGNLLDEGVLEDFIKDLDIIIHSAAIVSFHKADIDNMYDVNVEGTKNLVDLLIGSEKKLVHISSIATLGRKDGQISINENDFWNDNLPHSKYAHTKFLAEMEVQRGIAEGLQAMIFLPSIILGHAERGTSSASLWRQIDKFPSISPRGANGFVDVHDVVTYVKKGITDWKNDERMILNGHNIPYKKLYEMVHSATGRKINVRILNPRLILIILPFVNFFLKILGIPTTLGKDAVMTTSKMYEFENAHSIKLYGNHYSPLESSLERILSK